MNGTQICHVIQYYIAIEVLEKLCQEGKLEAGQTRKAQRYLLQKYQLEHELFDSFLD